jgi:DNA-binding NtrC family response regulator
MGVAIEPPRADVAGTPGEIHPVGPQRGSAVVDALVASGVTLTGIDGHLRKLEEIEHELIRFAIDKYEGHMSEVARRLGIGRSTLYRKLREMGIDDEQAGAA